MVKSRTLSLFDVSDYARLYKKQTLSQIDSTSYPIGSDICVTVGMSCRQILEMYTEQINICECDKSQTILIVEVLLHGLADGYLIRDGKGGASLIYRTTLNYCLRKIALLCGYNDVVLIDGSCCINDITEYKSRVDRLREDESRSWISLMSAAKTVIDNNVHLVIPVGKCLSIRDFNGFSYWAYSGQWTILPSHVLVKMVNNVIMRDEIKSENVGDDDDRINESTPLKIALQDVFETIGLRVNEIDVNMDVSVDAIHLCFNIVHSYYKTLIDKDLKDNDIIYVIHDEDDGSDDGIDVLPLPGKMRSSIEHGLSYAKCDCGNNDCNYVTAIKSILRNKSLDEFKHVVATDPNGYERKMKCCGITVSTTVGVQV